jgi:hypothetical protein
MKRDTKDILKRAMKNGFDLSFVIKYDEKKIFQGLYDFLVDEKFYCSMDGSVIYVGPDIIEDSAEITIVDKTLKIKPLTDRGFFDTLVALFKYIRHLASLQEEASEEDISTETDDDSSEEIWL